MKYCDPSRPKFSNGVPRVLSRDSTPTNLPLPVLQIEPLEGEGWSVSITVEIEFGMFAPRQFNTSTLLGLTNFLLAWREDPERAAYEYFNFTFEGLRPSEPESFEDLTGERR